MRIAINTRFLLPTKMEGFGWYTFEIVKRIVEQHPEHEFIFFFDRAYDEQFIFGENVTPVVLSPQARHPILFKIWFNRSVTRALKKHNADVFLSPDGYLSLKTAIKQIAVIHDINFEHYPNDIPSAASKYLRSYFPLFAKRADHIVTVSEYSKQDICTTYGIDTSKVTAVWNGASDEFKPLDASQQQAIREQHTGGAPYLLFVGAIHPRKNVGRLLEAFARMKEKTANNYKLMIVGEALFSNAGITIPERIKDDVVFTGHVDLKSLAALMASASVFTFVSYFEGFGIPLVEAMKCGTPILSGNLTSLPEVAGDAALYCDPFDVADIERQLTTLCTDEELRHKLSQAGLHRAAQFSWDTAADVVWKVIENVTQA